MSLSKHASEIKRLLNELKKINEERRFEKVGIFGTNKYVDKLVSISQSLASHLSMFKRYGSKFPSIERALGNPFLSPDFEASGCSYNEVNVAISVLGAALIDIEQLAEEKLGQGDEIDQLKDTVKQIQINVKKIDEKLGMINLCHKCKAVIVDAEAQFCGVCGTTLKPRDVQSSSRQER